MREQHWPRQLVRLGACREAVDWAAEYPDYGTAWMKCRQRRWMLWLWYRWVAKSKGSHREQRRLFVRGLAHAEQTVGLSEIRPNGARPTFPTLGLL